MKRGTRPNEASNQKRLKKKNRLGFLGISCFVVGEQLAYFGKKMKYGKRADLSQERRCIIVRRLSSLVVFTDASRGERGDRRPTTPDYNAHFPPMLCCVQ